jgi:hypothetical protein
LQTVECALSGRVFFEELLRENLDLRRPVKDSFVRSNAQCKDLTLLLHPSSSRDWLAACKGGQPASSNFEYAARLTEIVLLGNVALRTGLKLYYEGPSLKATNASEAEQFIKDQYRPGWEIT